MSGEGRARVTAVIQARCGSDRLPAKVLLPLAGRPVLGWVVRAARTATEVDDVVVATTTSPEDDAVEDLARSWGVSVLRGSPDDVLSRFVAVADRDRPDAVVRLTADCPMLDPAVIDTVVRTWRASPHYDYVSSVLHRTLPRGLDVELVTADALRRIDELATAHHRVHVTSYAYSEPSGLDILGLSFASAGSTHRVTLDTAADAQMLAALADGLGDAPPAWRDVVRWLDEHPDVASINAGVRQKALEQG
ncbi:cytidylyltransferase domain-containing protein [Cellulomonas cellasea]|uniref:Spore coat polysaccharide biosynthesis protein SpsF n=1 Tax=Cellulomonas cellasea TaxID=43670 RepID=A0A7W4UHW9_9CELL|nr:glycosyltransferase family protein [Cellulomonas cellasea]MBB2924154.1 spore coat polysaccharide biosynthesis protein SpsF [Cellulomonas cellasea]